MVKFDMNQTVRVKRLGCGEEEKNVAIIYKFITYQDDYSGEWGA